MNVTLKGLRTALDKVCLYLIPLLVIGIPFVMLVSTDKKGNLWLLPNLIPLVLTFGIMAGIVAAVYLVIGVVLSILSAEPISDEDMTWAQSHSRDERNRQLNRMYFRTFGWTVATLGTATLLSGIAVNTTGALSSIVGTASVVLFAAWIFLVPRSLKQLEGKERAHSHLRRIERRAEKAAA